MYWTHNANQCLTKKCTSRAQIASIFSVQKDILSHFVFFTYSIACNDNRDDSEPGKSVFDEGTITPRNIIELNIKEIGKMPCKTGSRRCIVARPMYKDVINNIYLRQKHQLKTVD
jgi:hypothetical protein